MRVFVTARKAANKGIPLVRARFYLDGEETHVEDIAGKSTPIPTEVDESSLSNSANAEIPAEVIEPGLDMVIEVDPEGTLRMGGQPCRHHPFRSGRLRHAGRGQRLPDRHPA